MTTKEVELQLNIHRATIRFYEKNGLLRPDRSENSYRNYSEEDVAELRRIIILRKLGISVSDIAELQKGSKNLATVLSENLEKLNEQLSQVTGAINMCYKLQDEGIDMNRLSDVIYWENVEQEEKKGNLFMSIAQDIYVYGKHRFLSFFDLEDSEGNNLYNVKDTVKKIISECFMFGIIFSIYEMIVHKKAFSIATFRDGFLYPVIVLVYMFFLGLPLYFLGKKYPSLARRLKIIGCISVFVLILIFVLLELHS